jgi:hypothetical protein
VGRTTNKQRREQQSLSARERAAAARTEQKRVEQRKRATTILASVVGVAVLVAAIAFVVIHENSSSGGGSSSGSGDGTAAPASLVKTVTSVPDATLTTVGKGSVATLPAAVTGQPPLTSGGKPELLYIGAEFCPFCAVERWSLAIALSKFGTLGNVGLVHSAANDGNYASLDFLDSTYTSRYLTFRPVENEDRSHNVIQTPTSAETALWNKLTNNQPGFPFVSFGNTSAFTVQAPLDPSALGTLTAQQIASQLADPTSKVAQVIDGGANDDIAAICTMTKNKPSTVCSAPAIGPLQTQIHG